MWGDNVCTQWGMDVPVTCDSVGLLPVEGKGDQMVVDFILFYLFFSIFVYLFGCMGS